MALLLAQPQDLQVPVLPFLLQAARNPLLHTRSTSNLQQSAMRLELHLQLAGLLLVCTLPALRLRP